MAGAAKQYRDREIVISPLLPRSERGTEAARAALEHTLIHLIERTEDPDDVFVLDYNRTKNWFAISMTVVLGEVHVIGSWRAYQVELLKRLGIMHATKHATSDGRWVYWVPRNAVQRLRKVSNARLERVWYEYRVLDPEDKARKAALVRDELARHRAKKAG